MGSKYIRQLRKRWGSLEVLWDSKRASEFPSRIQELFSRLPDFRRKAEQILYQCERLSIKVIPFWEEGFPPLLEEIAHPPVIIYKRGVLSLTGLPFVAVVGTRKPSSYGLQVTAYFVEALVEEGVVVVSGLAYGIDAQAHKATLERGGKTVAVLAHGLDMIYPSSHKRLAEAILATGAWISEYPPGTKLHPRLFPFRNRIIAGLSHLTLIVESGEKGGALFTARAAFEANRPVFAVPGSIFSPTSQGCHRLIADQIAHIAWHPHVALAELKTQLGQLRFSPPSLPEPKDPLEARIYALLASGARHVDEVALYMDLPVDELLMKLTLMEISGWIIQKPGGYIMRAVPPNAIS
ncbi:MAG: DNA-processing protein DprA [Bacteroidia bacterium]|nr:DNA-processing protein DprA [Bacteroidia bacterium]